MKYTKADAVEDLAFPSSSTGCIEFVGTKSRGYGQVHHLGKMVGAHRYSYEYHVGPVGDLVVRHKCDNRSCVNPEHLELGTYKDNTRDMIDRGRSAYVRGERHGKSKLTEYLVAEIHRMSALGFGGRAISYAVGVTKTHVNRVLSGESWSHV